MNLIASVFGESLTAAAVTVVLQVTFVLGITCGIACLIRRNAAARHAVCLAGLVLAVAFPLLAVNARPLEWTWFQVDLPVEERLNGESEGSLLFPDGTSSDAMSEVSEDALPATPRESQIVSRDEEQATNSVSVPPDVLYEPDRSESDREQETPLEHVACTDAVSTVVPPEQTLENPAAGSSVSGAASRRAVSVRAIVAWGLVVWIIGIFIQAVRWFAAHQRLKRLLRDVTELDPDRFGAAAADAASAANLNRNIPILSGPLVPIPLVYGLLRPRVLLPQRFAEQVDPGELRDVLIHECAHIARHDLWISLFQRIAAVLYWPHPLVYLINRQLTFAREELCDNYVLQVGLPSRFAELLVVLSEQYQPARVPVGLLSLFARRNRLEARVAGLLSQRRRTSTRLGRASRIGVLIAAVAILATAIGIRVGGQPSEATTDAVSDSDSGGSPQDALSGTEVAGFRNGFGLAFSPDSQLVAVGADDLLVRVFETASGQEVAILRGHDFPCDVIRFSPDGSELMTGGRKLLVWNTTDWSQVRSVALAEAHDLGDMTHDLERVVGRSSAERTIAVWDADSGQIVSGHELSDVPLSAAFSNDGARVAVGTIALAGGESAGRVLILDGRTLEQLQHFEVHPYSVSSLCFSADDRLLAGGMNWRATVWDLDEGTELRLLEGHSGVVESVAFSPDQTRLAVGSEGSGFRHQGGWRLLSEMKLWDPSDGSLIRSSAGELDRVQAIAFSPNGRWLAWCDGASLNVETVENDRHDWKKMLGDTQPLVPGSARASLPVRPVEEEIPAGDEEAPAPTENDASASIDASALLERLKQHCDPWINTPTGQLRSLQYTYTLGNDDRQVELVRGVSEVPRGMWYGSTLGTGLHWLLRNPDRFDVQMALLESELDRIELTIRPKPDEQRISLAIGNGISGSWRGYFSHPSDEMTLVVDAEHLLPLRETHRFGGDPKITEIQYLDWQRVSDEGWIPRRIDVTHDESVYRMHFAWREGVAWLLVRAETEYQGSTQEVARVSNVVVNDEELIQRSREEQRQRETAADTVRAMLEHNRPWLAGEHSGVESLSYTFHTLREDVKEECVVTDDGTVVMQVTHDGQGKMGDRLGERQTALASGEWARADSEDRFALVRHPADQEDGQLYAEQLRHYGRIGCQLDLPLFRYGELLDDATVEIEDGEWDGTSCRVATVRSLDRDVFLGCGTMLAFTSWSYVHHIRPVYETIYIDPERNVPLHETLISSRDNKRFEIDFGDYREIEPGQWAPLSIRIESPDYFTCELTFQLIEGRHWLLSEVESWFDPEDKSRGVVEDVTVNEPSELRDAALEQIEAARAVFGDADSTVSQTVEVPTHPFVLGRKIDLERLDVLFTIGRGGDLVALCSRDAAALEGPVSILVLDREHRLLSVGRSESPNGMLTTRISLGHSNGLSAAASFAVFLGDAPIAGEKAALRASLSGVASPVRINVADELEGKTRAIGLAIEESDDGGPLARVDLVSRDTGLEFGLDVPVCVFNAEGRLLSTGMKAGSLLVDGEIREEQWAVELSPFDTSQTANVVLGVTRGDVHRMMFGSRWMMLMDSTPIFSIEKLLSGETEETWWSGISQLAGQLNDDSMLEEFLHDPDRRTGERVQEQRRQDLLMPHIERLAFIAGHAQDPQLVAAAARLVGFAGNRAYVAALLPLLETEDPLVRDAAAVALGLLGRDDGLDRLRELLAMSPEELRDAHAIDLEPDTFVVSPWRWDDDILTALLMIGSDDAVRAAGDQVLVDLPALEVGTDDDAGKIVTGNPQRVARLWRLLGELQQPSAVDYLTRSLSWLSEHPAVAAAMNLQPLIIALVDYEAQTQELLAERIRRGDYATIRVLKESRNPSYIPAVREMMRNQATEPWTFHQGVSYLWNAGTDEALATMAELYEQRLPTDRRSRLWVCEALAYHGDDRGLPEAFEFLVSACAPQEPPEDADARRKWEREREHTREYPLDVFERAKSASRIAVVEQHLETDDVATQIACLAVLGTLRTALPDGVRDALERWSDLDNEEVATAATLLLQRD